MFLEIRSFLPRDPGVVAALIGASELLTQAPWSQEARECWSVEGEI
jgi:hypothetical protein